MITNLPKYKGNCIFVCIKIDFYCMKKNHYQFSKLNNCLFVALKPKKCIKYFQENIDFVFIFQLIFFLHKEGNINI